MNKLPRLLIAAPSSGSGKTVIVSGLLSALRKRGYRVQPFKIGPDYIDTGYHEAAGGRAAHNLDTWLTDKGTMADIFTENAGKADISIVEGVMGLYDGGRDGVSSSSEISKLLKIPVVLVIDAGSAGESVAAVAQGFRLYDEETDVRGVILNRLGSEAHKQMICEAMEKIAMPVLGAVFRDERLRLPERHLGLVPREENDESAIIKKIGLTIEKSLDVEKLIKIAKSAPELTVRGKRRYKKTPAKIKIGVARDKAFSFYYPESLDVFRSMGAEIVCFSPMYGQKLPAVSGLIFGGGFPEIFAQGLAQNITMLESVRNASKNGMPVFAECGGYIYLTESVRDFGGKLHSMTGVVPNKTAMRDRLQKVGYVEATALRDTVLCPAGTVVKGHEFHFSAAEKPETPENAAFKLRKNRTGEEYIAGYSSGNVLASYIHLHFAGAPELAAHFLLKCAEYARMGA